jgi:hypothetical protein
VKSTDPVMTLIASMLSQLLTEFASSNVSSTDNALQYRWHLPPYTAADNPSNREAIFALFVRYAYSVINQNEGREYGANQMRKSKEVRFDIIVPPYS